jgi:hypothetical protein
LIKQAEQIEERALAAAGGTHNRADISGPGLEGDTAKHMDASITLPEVSVKVFAAQGDISGG